MALLRKPGILLIATLLLASLWACRGAPRTAELRPPAVEPGQLMVRVDASAPDDRYVLYLEPTADGAPTSSEAERVEIVSDGDSFRLPVTAVHTGDRVRFVNRGSLTHRIFTADPESRREWLVAPRDRSGWLAVSRSGENRFYCSLHPDESLMIFAAPSPFFLVLDPKSDETIERIPAGRYRLSAWSEAGLRFLDEVEIHPGQATRYAMASPSSQ